MTGHLNGTKTMPGQDPAADPNPLREASRIIRKVEDTLHKDLKDLCILLTGLSQQGWIIGIDQAMQDTKCVLSVTQHFHRTIKDGLQVENQRIIRLGVRYEPAVSLIRKAVAGITSAEPQTETTQESNTGAPAQDSQDSTSDQPNEERKH